MIPNSLRKRKPKVRPNGYSDGSNLPYYTESSGLELLPFLKTLSVEPDKKITFNSAKLCLSVHTLYHRLNQAWMWLEDNHPEKDTWIAMRKDYCLSKERLNILIRKKSRGLSLLESGVVEDDDAVMDTPNWRLRIEEYVTESEDTAKPLELLGLNLQERDLDWLSTYLGSVDDRVAVIQINSRRVKIVKNKALAMEIKKKREQDV